MYDEYTLSILKLSTNLNSVKCIQLGYIVVQLIHAYCNIRGLDVLEHEESFYSQVVWGVG